MTTYSNCPRCQFRPDYGSAGGSVFKCPNCKNFYCQHCMEEEKKELRKHVDYEDRKAFFLKWRCPTCCHDVHDGGSPLLPASIFDPALKNIVTKQGVSFDALSMVASERPSSLSNAFATVVGGKPLQLSEQGYAMGFLLAFTERGEHRIRNKGREHLSAWFHRVVKEVDLSAATEALKIFEDTHANAWGGHLAGWEWGRQSYASSPEAATGVPTPSQGLGAARSAIQRESERREAENARHAAEYRKTEGKRESERQAELDKWERGGSILFGVGTMATIAGLVGWAVALHPWMIMQGSGWASYVFGPPLILFVTQIFAAIVAGSHASGRWAGVMAVATACGWIIVGTFTGVMLGCVLGIVSAGPFTAGFSNGVMMGYGGGVIWGACAVLVKLHKGDRLPGLNSDRGPFDL